MSFTRGEARSGKKLAQGKHPLAPSVCLSYVRGQRKRLRKTGFNITAKVILSGEDLDKKERAREAVGLDPNSE